MVELRILTSDDDFTDLLRLSRQFFKEYEAYHKDFFKLDQLTDQNISDYFFSFCENPTQQAFIAIEDGRMIGYLTAYIYEQASYWQVKRVGEISGLMVDARFRCQGLGRRLFIQARNYFENQGVKYFTVYTTQENKTGLEFYTENGMLPLYTTLIGET